MGSRQCELPLLTTNDCIGANGRLKQMRLIHKQGYTPDEIEDFR